MFDQQSVGARVSFGLYLIFKYDRSTDHRRKMSFEFVALAGGEKRPGEEIPGRGNQRARLDKAATDPSIRSEEVTKNLPEELWRNIRDAAGIVERFEKLTCSQQNEQCTAHAKNAGTTAHGIVDCTKEPLRFVHERTCAEEMLQSHAGRDSILRHSPFNGWSVRGNVERLTVKDLSGTDDPLFRLRLPRLRELIIFSGNQLTSIPESIGNLTALRSLELDENELTSLPVGIGNLTALTSLDVSGNQLTSLPDSIGKLTALEMLNLVDNNLENLPAAKIIAMMRDRNVEVLLS